MESFGDLLKNVPEFMLYLAIGFVLLAAFFLVYLWITPHDELRLIRAGNSAAALSLAGAVVGFMLPLAIVLSRHANTRAIILWGVVALIIQVVAFFIARAMVPGLPKAIEDGKISVGAFSGLVALAIGILNAACQTE